MDAEWKAKWLTALRSGEYKQGRGYLRSKDDEFCCLGVLCDICDPAKWIIKRGSIAFTYDHLGSTLPQSIYDAVGLQPFSSTSELMARNDGGGNDWHNNPQTFAQIADYIEDAL